MRNYLIVALGLIAHLVLGASFVAFEASLLQMALMTAGSCAVSAVFATHLLQKNTQPATPAPVFAGVRPLSVHDCQLTQLPPWATGPKA